MLLEYRPVCRVWSAQVPTLGLCTGQPFAATDTQLLMFKCHMFKFWVAWPSLYGKVKVDLVPTYIQNIWLWSGLVECWLFDRVLKSELKSIYTYFGIGEAGVATELTSRLDLRSHGWIWCWAVHSGASWRETLGSQLLKYVYCSQSKLLQIDWGQGGTCVWLRFQWASETLCHYVNLLLFAFVFKILFKQFYKHYSQQKSTEHVTHEL